MKAQPAEEAKYHHDGQQSNQSMISQQPLGSLEQTHETMDVANVWQQQHINEAPVVGFSNGNENKPGSQALYEQQTAGLNAQQHAIDSQEYVDNSLTKRKTPFGKRNL